MSDHGRVLIGPDGKEYPIDNEVQRYRLLGQGYSEKQEGAADRPKGLAPDRRKKDATPAPARSSARAQSSAPARAQIPASGDTK